ncbi:MAG: hypothetical protein CL851_06790 [Crocinitomicaceae bacterium]|nr:hypothetical protein [Crocinitomicaceae bacterium]
MHFMKEKDLVIFDLDGVLIDSKLNMEHAWNKVQKKANVEVKFEEYFKHIGIPFEDILEKIGIETNSKNIKKIFMTSSLRAIKKISFFKDTISILQTIKDAGKKIAIVTSKDETRTKSMVANLPEFDFISCPNSFLRGKPCPDHLLYTLAKCNCDPDRAIYIGDMSVDKEAAERANVDFLFAAWGYGEIRNCDSVYEFKDLLTYLNV